IVEQEIDALISVFYANRLSYSVWNTIPGIYIKAELEKNGVSEQQLSDLWAIMDPDRFKPLVPKDRILLFSAMHDQYVAKDDADRLWEAWDRPTRHLYPCGHAGLALYKKRICKDTLAFLEDKL
ncbi:MAG: abhydrolase domain-containing 18, partial [Bacilli bacterium]